MKLYQYLTQNNYRWTFFWMKEFYVGEKKCHELRHAEDFSKWSQKEFLDGKQMKTKPNRVYNGKQIPEDYKLYLRYDLHGGEAVIDIDEPDVFKQKYPEQYAAAMEQMENTPHYKSRGKRLPHILITTDYKGKKIAKGKVEGYDFLTDCPIWARADEELINFDKEIEHETIDYTSVIGGGTSKTTLKSKDTMKSYQNRPLVQQFPIEIIQSLFGLNGEDAIIPPDKCDKKWNWMCLAKILQQHYPEEQGRDLFDEISMLSPDYYKHKDSATGLNKKACCDAYYNMMSHNEKCKASITMLYRWAIDSDPAAFNLWKLRWNDVLHLPTNFARNKPFNFKLLTGLCASIKHLSAKEDEESKEKKNKQLKKALEYFSCYAFQINASSKGRGFGITDFNLDGTTNDTGGISHSYESDKAFKDHWKDRGFEIYVNPKTGKKQSLIDAWIEWVERRVYERITFDPDFYNQKAYQHGAVNELNLYDGLEYEWDEDFWTKIQTNETAKATHNKLIKPFKNFLKKVVCSGRGKCYKFLLKYLKGILTGRKLECCLCLLGEKGTGKTFLFEKIMCSLLGSKYYLTLGGGSYQALLNEKNAYFKNKLMVVWDEAGKFRGSKMKDNQILEDAFKKVITQKEQFIRELYKDGITIPDFITHIILSNDDDAVPIQSDSRRFWIMDMCADYANNTKYWTLMNNHHGFGYDMSRAENEAQKKLVMKHIFHFLMSQDLTGFKEKDFPNTQETLRAKRLGVYTTDKFLYWYAKNNPYQIQKTKKGRMTTASDLYKDYERFCNAISASKIKMKHEFSSWCHTNKRASRLFGNQAIMRNGYKQKLVSTKQECKDYVAYCEKRWDLPTELKELKWDLNNLDEESDEDIVDSEEECSDTDDDVTIDTDDESDEEEELPKPSINKILSKEFHEYNQKNIIIPVKTPPDSDDSSEEEDEDKPESTEVKRKPLSARVVKALKNKIALLTKEMNQPHINQFEKWKFKQDIDIIQKGLDTNYNPLSQVGVPNSDDEE